MKETLVLASVICFAAVAALAFAGEPLETDTFETPSGKLSITFVGHGSLIFDFGGTVVHVDPFGKVADYDVLPKADLILVTHEHRDHLDPDALNKVRRPGTTVVANSAAGAKLDGSKILANGGQAVFAGIPVEAVPAYNIRHLRDSGEPFHPRGNGNGYVLTFGAMRVYVAGDTENIPEMKELSGIDVAFLPMNLPYTMTPEMAADAALMIRPKVLYPYHFGDSDTSRLSALLKGEGGIEVRVRRMQ